MLETALLFQFLFLLLGLVLGSALTWLFLRSRNKAALSETGLAEKYVLKEVHENILQQLQALKEDLAFAEQNIQALNIQLATQQTENKFLAKELNTQQTSTLQLQQQARLEFENIANRLLEEKSQKFTLQNRDQIENLLRPLQEKIKVFGENVESKFVEETKQRSSLQQEIEHLRLLNTQLSQGAENLVNALRGDSKTQGDWGEFQLELLLQKAGLQKGLHFRTQTSFKDTQGNQKRPDFLIELPNDRQLVLDAKVSLVAYEQYCSTDDPNEKAAHLKRHVTSIRRHIKDLNSKNYQQLLQINAPDYVLLFIPLEPAFTLAVQDDPSLFTDALDYNIVLVTNSTLLATMRTVAYIWNQERQKKNVLEIARQSGLLYDKFVNFVQDLQTIGQKVEDSMNAYQAAMNKLKDSPKYGDTLVGRAERIKQLGAKASKSLPQEWIENGDLDKTSN